MDGLLNIFSSLVNTETVNLPVILNSLDTHQSFRSKNLSANDAVIQHITSLLSKPPTRYEGFLILTTFLEQCSLDVIEQKGVLWATIAIKTCIQKGSDSIVPYAYGVLRTLTLKSVEIPDLTKSFSSGLIFKICDTLNSIQPSGHIAALKCIETCLKTYPGPCGPSRTAIEQFLIKLFDSTDENLINWSGKCFHLLQQIRGGGNQGCSHQVAWQIYQMKLCGSLHNILDITFANCSEVYDEPKEISQLNLKPLELSDEPVQKAIQLFTRFKNLTSYLAIALREPFPVSKSIMPKKIINVIARGLAINSNMLEKNNISDNLAIGALLPNFHTLLLKLLDALILMLRSHLSGYYKQILGFIYETLRWTSSKKSAGCQKPYIKLRVAAYNSLSLWCTTFQHGSCVELIGDGILEQIHYDITPFQNEFTLQVISGGKKHMSKKARKQLHKIQNDKSNLAQTHSKHGDSHKTKIIYSDAGNQILCFNALRCLKSILNSASTFLKAPLIKEVHNKVLKICIQLNGNLKLNGDHLYGSSYNREELYDILLTLITASNHLCPPPTQVALKLLTERQVFDSQSHLRQKCSNLVKVGEKLIHPQKECLYFPADIREIKNAFNKYGKSLETMTNFNPDENHVDSDDDEESTSSDENVQNKENCIYDVDESETDDRKENGIETIDKIVIDEDDVVIEDDCQKDTDDSSSVKTCNALNDKIEILENNPQISVPNHISKANVNGDSVDLTSEDEVDSFSKTDEPRKRKLQDLEIINCPDSPEIILRVDDDEEDDDVQLIDGTNIEIETSNKKRKLNEETVDQEKESKTNGVSPPENDDELIAAIAATFVDELI